MRRGPVWGSFEAMYQLTSGYVQGLENGLAMDEEHWNQGTFTRTHSSPIIAAPGRGSRGSNDGNSKQIVHRSSSELHPHAGYAGTSYYGEHMYGGGKKTERRQERETHADHSGVTGRRWSSADEVENHHVSFV